MSDIILEALRELKKLDEETLDEKDGFKKAAVAAGLLAAGAGAGAGINQAVNNYNNTRETPISVSTQTTENEDDYLSYNNTSTNTNSEASTLNKTVGCKIDRAYLNGSFDQGLSVRFSTINKPGTATFTEDKLILKGNIVNALKEYLDSVGTKYRISSIEVRSNDSSTGIITQLGSINLASPTATIDEPYIEDNLTFPITYGYWNDKYFNLAKSVSFWVHIDSWQS